MRQIRKFFDPYVGAMLLTVLLAFQFPARGAGIPIAETAADIGIAFLFFLYGARLSPKAALDGLLAWRLHIAVLLCTFVLFPLIGLGIRASLGNILPIALSSGIVFLCIMPSTVQSSIAMTSIARGNVPAAICAASASNILGIFISPLLAGALMQAPGFSLSFDIFRDISLQLLAPFLLGQLMRPRVGHIIHRYKDVFTLADRGSILLIIYVAFSRGMRDGVFHQLSASDLVLLLAILSLLLAAILLITAFIARKIMRLHVEDAIVLLFCGSKKSLASGLPMATILFSGPQLSLIVLPLMLFHQIQLIMCAILARKYSARPAEIPGRQDAAPAAQTAARNATPGT